MKFINLIQFSHKNSFELPCIVCAWPSMIDCSCFLILFKKYIRRACFISYYWACAHINLGLPVRVKLSFHGFVHKCLRIDSKNLKIHSSRSVRAPSNFCARAPILFVARAPKNFCARTLFFRAYTLTISLCMRMYHFLCAYLHMFLWTCTHTWMFLDPHLWFFALKYSYVCLFVTIFLILLLTKF